MDMCSLDPPPPNPTSDITLGWGVLDQEGNPHNYTHFIVIQVIASRRDSDISTGDRNLKMKQNIIRMDVFGRMD
ncbi:hypothetical protein DPEC_G00290050 [Dallia pectoralis]|uniref:Uncharacterized protein n=1 Tax=Dallia pectoralis TaxID=75939 RepID=A0ACC2FHL3_DALPE|nr:hypothetical protein DPEC_G00290050 [Dallia pectoralis]